jgi:hypothetical protein
VRFADPCYSFLYQSLADFSPQHPSIEAAILAQQIAIGHVTIRAATYFSFVENPMIHAHLRRL